MKLSIIIPTLNEEATISEVIRRVESVNLGSIKKEIIVVDDDSSDRTGLIVKQLSKKHKNVILISRKSQLKGKSKAIQEGLTHCTGDIIIIQDADLEYDPDDYGRLIAPIVNGAASVVYGSRFIERKWPKNMAWGNFLANKSLSFLTNALYQSRITDEATGYKVFSSDVLRSITLTSVKFDFCPEVTAKILKKGIKIQEVPISYVGRNKQQGKKINIKDGIMAFWTLIKYHFVD
jgi:dolichol-phosphate mannosyltransferase